jgi:DNA polymerase-3 subunit beta
MVKFTISKSALVAVLDNSSKVVPPGGVRAGTDGIRIEVRKDKAAFRATNGDSSIQQVVSITNGADGAVYVPARQLREFAAIMPDGDIQIQESGSNLTMSVGKVAMTLNLLRVDDAPVVTFPTGDGVAIPARTFADALGQVASASVSSLQTPTASPFATSTVSPASQLVPRSSPRRSHSQQWPAW